MVVLVCAAPDVWDEPGDAAVEPTVDWGTAVSDDSAELDVVASEVEVVTAPAASSTPASERRASSAGNRAAASSAGNRNEPGPAIAVLTLLTAANPTRTEAVVASTQAQIRTSRKFTDRSLVTLAQVKG